MATSRLITTKKSSLFQGVNQQAATYRFDEQVEEMINCIPTLEMGTRLRNPSLPIALNYPDGTYARMFFPENEEGAFVYEYDRGLFAGNQSVLAFIITKNGGLEIIDLTAAEGVNQDGQPAFVGTLYTEFKSDGTTSGGINYPPDEADGTNPAREYVNYFTSRNGYAMTTVKDTTFVVNKMVAPKMNMTVANDEDPILDVNNIVFDYAIQDELSTSPEDAVPVSGDNTQQYLFDWTAPENIVAVEYDVQGGGGGGAGGDSGDTNSDSGDNDGGGGGAAGQLLHGGTTSITAGQVLRIEVAGQEDSDTRPSGGNGVGACGDGNNGDAGHGGKTSSFNGLVASGGGGGGSSSASGQDGVGGTASFYAAGGNGGGGHENNPAWGGNGKWGSGGGGSGASGNGDCVPPESSSDGAGGSLYSSGCVDIRWSTENFDASAFLRTGYIWIKYADVVGTGYSYGAVVRVMSADGLTQEDINVGSTGDIDTGSNDAATELATLIRDNSLLDGRLESVVAVGSLIKVELLESTGETMANIDAYDSFGDTASFGWAHSVEAITDLPKDMATFFPIVEVGSKKGSTYWVHFDDGIWKEYRDPRIYSQLEASTMPHTITRSADGLSFSVAAYGWDSRKIGDDSTNPIPSFCTNFDTGAIEPIKDIFFFRNRLGFITEASITLSEVGKYGNFFRTTVAAVLDSDKIEAGVESINAVNLQYAVALEDSMMLFADKAQFRFSGGTVLSPANHKIQQEMAYDVDTAVRPLFMNDRIFFVAPRGKYSSVYEMRISNNSGQNSEAFDITSHVQEYISGNVEKLSGSAVNNTLFLTSREYYDIEGEARALRNTVFTYKYLDSGGERQQAAWSKHTFKGNILSGFAVNKHFYLMINRKNALFPVQTVVGTGQWSMSLPWVMSAPWVMSPDSFGQFKQFERMNIHPNDIDGIFLDNYDTPIKGNILFGEWVYGKEGNKSIRGTLKLKTVEIEAQGALKLYVIGKQRNTYREVASKFALHPRKPMVYGDSTNVVTGVKNEGSSGFRLDMVSFEGRITRRATST